MKTKLTKLTKILLIPFIPCLMILATYIMIFYEQDEENIEEELDRLKEKSHI